MYHLLPVLLFTIEISISNCGRICLSCSGVESVAECSDVEICADDEVCFTQKYQTPTKQQLFDYGCSYHQFCISGNSGSVFGKRLTGHHILCHNCCNNTNVCNIRSLCGSDTCSSHETKDSKLPRECDDLSNVTTGIYTIYPDGINPVQVYCIVANSEKWTVIQRRFNGLENFDRNWEEYKTGFGSVSGEYWLGNDNIHRISTSTSQKLSIYLEDFNGNFAYANYSVFSIGDEHRKYQLRVEMFSGTSGLSNRLSESNKFGFSTRDQDNDEHPGSCYLMYFYGAWWYGNCGNMDLNGPYMAGPISNHTGMTWYGWPKGFYSLKKSTMMIKRFYERP